jgi:hypothetical protein
MKFKILFFLVALVSIVACGGDDVDCSDPNAVTTEYNAEIQKLNTASTAFGNDPQNSDRCNDYKNALNDFIDFSESISDCTELQQANIQTQLDEARTAVNSISCN